MRVYVHYDLEGTIHSFVTANASEGSGMMLVPRPGILVAEVEGLQPQPTRDGHVELRETAKSHVVGNPQGRITLVKKC
jgi:hypothetical protein